MVKNLDGAVTATAPVSKRIALFSARAWRLRLWAQEQFGEKALQNLMDVAMDGKVTAACAIVEHTIGRPMALPAVAANKREDSVAAIEGRGAQLREKLDRTETRGSSGISAESD